MYLSYEDLVELTECQQNAAQIRWLRKNGWTFFLGNEGGIKVTWAHHNAKFNGAPRPLEESPVMGGIDA